MTYLELVQSLAGISGTVDPRAIDGVQGTTGRIRFLANVVEMAWTEIQNTYHAWSFLTVEFPDGTALLQNAPRGAHTAETLLGQNNNWAEWIPGTAPGTIPLSIWSPAIVENGVEVVPENRADERVVPFLAYDAFRDRYGRGVRAIDEENRGRPQVFSVDLQDRLVFWPIPNLAYRCAGTYRRTAQQLAADDDVPIVGEQYHQTIVHAAKLLLDHADEADGNVLLADIELPMTFQASLASLRRRYLRGGSGSLSRGTAVGQGSSFRPVAPVSVVVNT